MNVLINFLSLFLFLTSISVANEVKVFEFTEAELSNLEVRKVRGADNKTEYSVGSNDNGNYLKAVADNAASGLGKKVVIDLNKTPIINITWKIEKSLDGIKGKYKKRARFRCQSFCYKKNWSNSIIKQSYKLCVF